MKMESTVLIEYCAAWRFDTQAASLADDLMMQFAGKLQTAAIKPSDRTGCFEVYLQDELVYSKLKIGILY